MKDPFKLAFDHFASVNNNLHSSLIMILSSKPEPLCAPNLVVGASSSGLQ